MDSSIGAEEEEGEEEEKEEMEKFNSLNGSGFLEDVRQACLLE